MFSLRSWCATGVLFERKIINSLPNKITMVGGSWFLGFRSQCQDRTESLGRLTLRVVTALYSVRVSMELGISMRKFCYLNPCSSDTSVLLPRSRTRVRGLVSSMNCLKFGSSGFREWSDRLQLFY